MSNFKKPFLQEIEYNDWEKKGISVSVLREDIVHPFINGNKWRKLKYNIVDFRNSGYKTLLTFGGAYSNHLVATSAMGKEEGISTVGIVRGENVSNDYLDFAKDQGMKLHFISRTEYRDKSDKNFIRDLLIELKRSSVIKNDEEVFILPEGGSNSSAVKGASEIVENIPTETDIIICPCGTGATIAGISQKLLSHQRALGVSVLKANDYFEKEIEQLNGINDKIEITYDYHFGGYAKKNSELIIFCSDLTTKTGIPTEPVYSGKMFYAIDNMIKNDRFKSGTRITAIHTGGIFKFE